MKSKTDLLATIYNNTENDVQRDAIINAVDLYLSQPTSGKYFIEKDAVKEPPEGNINEHFICLIEQRGNGKVIVKPAYAQWMYSKWFTEDGYTVISYLSPITLPEGRVTEEIFSKDPINFLLVNALRVLDKEKMQILTKSLADRCGLTTIHSITQ